MDEETNRNPNPPSPPATLFGGVKRWLRPKTHEDRCRNIDINLNICIVNMSLAILFIIATIIKRLMDHQ